MHAHARACRPHLKKTERGCVDVDLPFTVLQIMPIIVLSLSLSLFPCHMCPPVAWGLVELFTSCLIHASMHVCGKGVCVCVLLLLPFTSTPTQPLTMRSRPEHYYQKSSVCLHSCLRRPCLKSGWLNMYLLLFALSRLRSQLNRGHRALKGFTQHTAHV